MATRQPSIDAFMAETYGARLFSQLLTGLESHNLSTRHLTLRHFQWLVPKGDTSPEIFDIFDRISKAAPMVTHTELAKILTMEESGITSPPDLEGFQYFTSASSYSHARNSQISSTTCVTRTMASRNATSGLGCSRGTAFVVAVNATPGLCAILVLLKVLTDLSIDSAKISMTNCAISLARPTTPLRMFTLISCETQRCTCSLMPLYLPSLARGRKTPSVFSLSFFIIRVS